MKYEEVYLKAYANVLEAQRRLEDHFRFYNDLRPHQAWATGPRPRCSMGSREFGKRSIMEGGVHPVLGQNYWQERLDSHSTPP